MQTLRYKIIKIYDPKEIFSLVSRSL